MSPNAVKGARLAAGAVAAGVLAVAIAAAGLAPLPSVRVEPPRASVTPVAAAQRLVCAGGAIRLSDEQGQNATALTAVGQPTVQSASTGDPLEEIAIESSEAGSGGTPSAPLALELPAGARNTLVAGAQSQRLDSDELVGYLASDCVPPTSDSWLVGGSTTLGNTTLLSLVNASAVPSTVAVGIVGENGAVAAPGATGIVIAPGEQRLFPLAGLAPGVVSPVVHVESRGGAIAASLQQSLVRGLETGGVDTVSPGRGLARDHQIPGVVLSGVETAQGRAAEPGYADLDTVLRLYLPGDAPGAVTVSVVPEAAGTAGASFATELQPGVVTELPLDVSELPTEGLGDGAYTVRVESDLPLAAGVRASNAAQGLDLAWFASAPALRDEAFVAVASGPSPSLHLSNPGSSAQSVRLAALGGEESSIEVPAGSAVTVPVSASTSYRMSGAAGMSASVSFAGDGALAGYPVRSARAEPEPVVVYP